MARSSPLDAGPPRHTARPRPPQGTSVMPLFPLGAAYLPHTTPVLNIFEPRYRAMYNDILFNGARRFMVTNVEPETGALAEVGVVFYLDELKEVSEQTQDRVKYVGQHSIIGRVQLKKVLELTFAKEAPPLLPITVVPRGSAVHARCHERRSSCGAPPQGEAHRHDVVERGERGSRTEKRRTNNMKKEKEKEDEEERKEMCRDER